MSRELDTALVADLVATQFPEWSELPIEPVVPGGWDNRTFRLGAALSVRLPSAACYEAQVEKEQRWLPLLAQGLPLPIPEPVARGRPGQGFPRPWSVYRWLEGESAHTAPVEDRNAFALALADFLATLQQLDAAGGPPAGEHNFYRGGPLATYDGETRAALEALGDRVDRAACGELWERALASDRDAAAVWVHGDLAPSNLLVRDGRLAAVIDFGCLGVGDPACDLTIAWTFLAGDARRTFLDRLGATDELRTRARAWGLWKCLITLADPPEGNVFDAPAAGAALEQLLADE